MSKAEASLGLVLLAALLVGLGFAYVYQLDSPPPVSPPDPNWAAAKAEIREDRAVERTAYRPQWLESQSDKPTSGAVR